jgi:AAA+ ATPase superfamily predicted ATPase
MILNIGVNCQIDLSKYEEEGLRIFITGQSGSGKSYLAKIILEELANLKIPIVIIDPEGEYTAFKERYSSLIIGGERGIGAYEGFNLDNATQIVDSFYGKYDHQMLIFDTSELPSSEQDEIHKLILEAVFRVATFKKEAVHFINRRSAYTSS